MTHPLQPYLIVPLLIEQPTWGGSYIAQAKGISDFLVKDKKIGQSFELAKESLLISFAASSATKPMYALTSASDLAHPTFSQPQQNAFSLQSLIDESPEAVLGRLVLDRSVLGASVLKQHSPAMTCLIKFTQAQENSYQAHVKLGEEFDSWQAKPESWYYFEDGAVTLGIKDSNQLDAYHMCCEQIDAYAHSLSEEIHNGKHNLSEAKKKLAEFISNNHPKHFINELIVQKGSVVDLSQGGIHHSWERHPDLPLGNIVYEVQKDVKDDFCTLRSFDQGKMKDDGTLRQIHIADYFQALDKNPAANQPKNYISSPTFEERQNFKVKTLFTTPFYSSKESKLINVTIPLSTIINDQSYVHVFVREGSVYIQFEGEEHVVRAGWSAFIPADCIHETNLKGEDATCILTHQ